MTNKAPNSNDQKRRRMVRARRARGFTLLELILAMGVMCLLAMTLYAALRTAFRAEESTTAAVERVRAGQVAMQEVSRDLGSALPPNPNAMFAGTFYGVPAGSGTDMADMVEFYTIASGVSDDDPTHADGMKRIDLTLDVDTDGAKCLVKRVQGNLAALEETEPETQILCRNVNALTLEYFDGTQWTDSWDSSAMQDTLPIAVRVTIEMAPAGRYNTTPYRLSRVFYLACTVPSQLTGGT